MSLVNLQAQFAFHHIRPYIAIQEKGSHVHLCCPYCDMFSSRSAEWTTYFRMAMCETGICQKQWRFALKASCKEGDSFLVAYGSLL